jgi:hypothetical protein
MAGAHSISIDGSRSYPLEAFLQSTGMQSGCQGSQRSKLLKMRETRIVAMCVCLRPRLNRVSNKTSAASKPAHRDHAAELSRARQATSPYIVRGPAGVGCVLRTNFLAYDNSCRGVSSLISATNLTRAEIADRSCYACFLNFNRLGADALASLSNEVCSE